MKQIRFIILFIISCYHISLFSQNLNSDRINIIEEQKQILAKLTGETKIDGKTTLKSRQTKSERQLTRSYLKELINGLSLESKEHVYDNGINIYTTLPATIESEDYIILGAHFDSVKNCPGANDNASGSVLIYSVIKQLAQLKSRNKNIIVVFFDQEESGLIGSRAFAKYVKNQKLNIHSAHTVDQMGWDKDNDRAIELELPTEYLENAYRLQAEKLDIPVHKTKVSSTDHTAFREIGYNAIGITEEYVNKDTTPHYHQPSDTFETINFEYLQSTTNLVFYVLKELISSKN